MLLHKDEMYKPHVARLVLVHVLRIKDQWKQSSGSVTSFTAVLYISHAFLSHGEASEHQVLFQTWEKQLKENAKFFRLFMEIKPYLKYMSSSGLKDSEWDVKTM